MDFEDIYDYANAHKKWFDKKAIRGSTEKCRYIDYPEEFEELLLQLTRGNFTDKSQKVIDKKKQV